jgi:oligopeptide transport system substrate-binding protein
MHLRSHNDAGEGSRPRPAAAGLPKLSAFSDCRRQYTSELPLILAARGDSTSRTECKNARLRSGFVGQAARPPRVTLRRYLAAVFAVVCLFLSSAPALFAMSRTLEEANRHKILLINEISEPQTLDPQICQGQSEQEIINSLMVGLVENDEYDQAKVVPGLADHWDHNEDYSVWTFHIRDNAKWSNGDPVIAQDFVDSYRRILTASLGAVYSEALFIMKGARDYYEQKSTDFNQVGVHAEDPHTLRIELIGPTPYLLSAILYPCWYPVHMPTILKFGKMDERDTKWTTPGNYVGTGPFIIKTWRQNDVIEVVRNPLYWDAATVKLNGINFYSIENSDTAERAFEAGQLHKTLDVPLDRIPYYRREHPELIRIEPFVADYFYRLNTNRKPLDNPKVRLALNLAVNREEIVTNITRAKQRPETGLVPPGMDGYEPLDVIHYDPERARQLLAEAGYPNGKGFPKFNILINTHEAHRVIAEAIQQMWKQELNIDVGIENQEWKVYLQSQNSMNYDMCRGGWIGDFMDPSTFLSIWTTGNGNNATGWSNPTYDQLIDQAAHTGDPQKRFEILHDAERLFLSEPAVVCIYWYTRFYLLDPSVKNWNPLALDVHNYKYIDLETPEESSAPK